MVYCIKSKTQIKGTLTICRSLHVGGFGTSTNVDLPLATNGQGEIYIPGTSLAGALRGWMSRIYGSGEANKLWGWQDLNSSTERGHASRVFVEDATVTLGGKPMTPKQMEIRSGVGIDRHSGTAAENYLYNRGVIPRGATLDFAMSVEEMSGSDSSAMDSLLLALTSEDIRLGAAKSRGLGRVRLSDVRYLKSDWSSRAGMLKFLKHTCDRDGFTQWNRPSEAKQVPKLKITLDWKPIGPLMVKSEMTGDVVDILPLMGRTDGEKLAFLLPGSSIKGALRSQAERIVRTVLDLSEETDDLTQQMDLPLIRELFGWTTRETSGSNGARQNGKMGALFIEDCFSDTKHPLDTLRELSQVPKDNPVDLQKLLGSKQLAKGQLDTQVAYHVAVDRWTGGATDGFLYTNLEPFNLPWEPIEFSLDWQRLSSTDETSDELATVALLLLLIRTMSERKVPLGYGTNRGMGSLALRKVTIDFQGELPSDLAALRGSWSLQGDRAFNLDVIDSHTLEVLHRAWAEWVELNREERS
ncbi:MAG: RAMP superfamily CRISPR-associated protein [Cyanobacteria bacterium P01_G01_bin.4]